MEQAYEPSDGLDRMLKPYDYETIVMMKYTMREYFEKGIEPDFESMELRDLWFYCKVHELAEQIQKYGYGCFGTFPYIELRQELNLNGAKLNNWHFQIRRRNGTDRDKH